MISFTLIVGEFFLVSGLVMTYALEEFLMMLDWVRVTSLGLLLASDLVTANTAEEGQLLLPVLSKLQATTVLTS